MSPPDPNRASKPNPSIVVFDLGGVLIDWNPRYLYRKVMDDEAEIERFLAEVWTHERNLSLDAGRTFDEVVAELVDAHPDWADHIRTYRDRWEEMIAGALDDTVAVFNRVRAAGIPTYGLTNWSAETFPIAQARFAFLHRFDGIVVSGVEREVKPDRAIYDILTSRYGFRPEDAVFIDDAEKNILAARDLGFHTVHFNDAETLADALRRLGLLD